MAWLARAGALAGAAETILDGCLFPVPLPYPARMLGFRKYVSAFGFSVSSFTSFVRFSWQAARDSSHDLKRRRAEARGARGGHGTRHCTSRLYMLIRVYIWLACGQTGVVSLGGHSRAQRAVLTNTDLNSCFCDCT